jgi:hypothetical protein
LRQPQDKLVEYARVHEIRCVDLLPAMAETAASVEELEEKQFHDANHFSKAGHRQVAELLVAPVVESLRLEQPAESEPAPRSE